MFRIFLALLLLLPLPVLANDQKNYLVPLQEIRVVDGDTVRITGLGKIRLLGFDTPEMRGRCSYESQLAAQATNRLKELLRNSDQIEFTTQNRIDRYGRLLGSIYVDGLNVGQILISERLAREYRGRRLPWC